MRIEKMRTETGFRFTWHADPGHSWLCVPLELLRDLAIQDQISPFGDTGKGVVHLEEDCDAPLFLTAFRKQFPDFTIETTEVHTNDEIWIRRLPPYQATNGRKTR